MTDFAIQEQVEVIKKATEKASKTKETAIRFLTNAGIISDLKKLEKSQKEKK